MEEFQNLQAEIAEIKARNARVEADKAWETSAFRTCLLMGMIYIVAVAMLYVIEISNFLASALVPTVGFFLSTQSLPMIKSWWIKRHSTKK